MKEFRDKVAVVTGAASGIGRALVQRCAHEGMKVVLADVEEEPLLKTEEALRGTGATVMAVRTDVSKAKDIEALAQKTLQAFGAVHLLVNNAGVGAGTTVWGSTLADWEWVVGVNLWGVVHGIRVFVPVMLEQSAEGHIVNTASVAGLISGPGLGVYKATKHAVVSISETLHCELAATGAKIKVSVLCPGWVHTRIMDCARNRPVELRDAASIGFDSPDIEAAVEAVREAVEAGMSPEEVAERVFAAVRAERFYILTHPEFDWLVQKRMEDILRQRNPAE